MKWLEMKSAERGHPWRTMGCCLSGRVSHYPPKAFGSDKAPQYAKEPRPEAGSNQMIREIIRFDTIRNFSPEEHPAGRKHAAIPTKQHGRSSACFSTGGNVAGDHPEPSQLPEYCGVLLC
jgi:hypothetical protein